MRNRTEIDLFGVVRVRREGTEIDLTGSLPGQVLRILVLRMGEAVSRKQLVDGIYEDNSPATAPAQLQAHVSRLRKILGPYGSLIETIGDGYRIGEVPSGVAVDVLDFERDYVAGHSALQSGECSRAAQSFRQALARWGDLTVSDPVAAGVDASISRLHQLRLSALESRTEAELQLGRHAELIPELEKEVRANPHEERLRRLLSVVPG